MPSVITPCGGGGGGGDFVLLASTEPNVAVSAIAFSGIDQSYTHLMLVMQLRTTSGGGAINDLVMMNFNGDSSAKYNSVAMVGYGSSVAAFDRIAQTEGWIGNATAVAVPDYFTGSFVVTIPRYRSPASYKAWISDNTLLAGTTTPYTERYSVAGVWWKFPTEAITEITITPLLGAAFESNAQASLYGLT